MHKRAAWVMAVGLGLGLAGTARAEQPGADQAGASHEQGGLREARGKVKGVDKSKNQLTLDNQGLTLQVDRTTTIFIDGRTGSLDEVTPGQEVRASYEHKKGANKAQWIEVSKKPRKPDTSREQLPEAPGPGGSPQPGPSIPH